MYLQTKNTWGSYCKLDKELKEELDNMTDEQAREAFSSNLEFGTGGLRGILGVGTNRMNYYVVRRATAGFGRYLAQFDNAFNRGIVIAHDNRKYSKEFALDSAKVLTSIGYKVYLFPDLRPTPLLSFAVRNLGCVGGIMITASHNPKEYNGYKIYDCDGCQLVPKDADKVIDEINKIENLFDVEISDDLSNIIYLNNDIDLLYQKKVSEIVINNNLKKDFKIVYTPLHGTGSVFASKLLKDNGYNCFEYLPQMTNDPNFSNVDSSNPEEEKAYKQAVLFAEEINAPIVLANDPDADRLGVMVLHNDEYVLLNGNQTATLMVDYILKNLQKENKLPDNGYIFSTNVSSSLPIKIAKSYGLKSVITLTGFKFIGEQAKLIENSGTYVFGYEESYGSLIKDFVRDKDGIQAILMACEVFAYYNEQNKTLIDALDDIYKEYGYTKEGISNIVLKGLDGATKIKDIMNYFRVNELQMDNIVSKEDNLLNIKTIYKDENISTMKIDLPISNVIKYEFSDGSNFVLRPSGTEPKLKVYYNMIGNSSVDVSNKLSLLESTILKIINNI